MQTLSTTTAFCSCASNDIRMPKTSNDLNLPQKSFCTDRGAELGIEKLERDWTAVPEIVGEVDGRHSNSANLAVDAIPARKGVV